MRLRVLLYRLLIFATSSILFAPCLMALKISPTQVTVTENRTQQFTASGAVTWATDCGTVSSSGLFTAPLYPTLCTITVVAIHGNGQTASATANVISPITVSPIAPKTPQGATQRFTASAAVTWAATCGSIGSTGLFTASAPVGSQCKIVATATTNPKYTANTNDTVTAPVAAFTIAPSSATVVEGATKQFTASAAASWAASCGTISSLGLFTAPLKTGACTITATAADGSGHTAAGTATITSPLTVTPSTARTIQGQTQQFTASAAVTWAATCGSIGASGLFTASAALGSICQINATASAGTRYTASASDTIYATTTSHIKTVWVINMENKNWTGDTLANNVKGNPAAPYINNTLVPLGAHAEVYVNLIHPSEPNKIWEEAGSNLGITDDSSVATNHQSTTNHLVTLLTAAGKTWKAYDEFTDGTTCPVASWHTGIIFFDDVTNNRDSTYIPCINHFRPLRELQIDLNANTVANYNYINPGPCHEMHETTGCTTITQEIQQGDAWLAQEIPSIMASAAYRNGGAIFIIWDEDNAGTQSLPALVLSPFIKPGFASYTTYTHNSLLRTVQEIFNVSPLIRGAATASDMSSMFSVFP